MKHKPFPKKTTGQFWWPCGGRPLFIKLIALLDLNFINLTLWIKLIKFKSWGLI
jgi:hypothetical protein